MFVVDASTKRKDYKVPAYASIFEKENGGYAYGLNKGLERAMEEGFKNFVFINDDTTVAKDFVNKAKQAIAKHPASLIGGKLYYFKGNEFHKEKYDSKDLGNVLWFAGGKMDWAHSFGVHRGVDEVDNGQYDNEEKTEFVTGCLMMFDKALIEKAGEMDDSYFMYYEDTDWCQQNLKAGCELWYDPGVVIWHKNAQSSGGSGSDLHLKYQRRNRLKFGLRYAPIRTKLHLIKNFVIGRS